MFLIVDDCVSTLRLMKWKLQAAFGKDTEVILVHDGEEAMTYYMNLLQAGKSESVEVILMDHHMPKCSGMDAIKYIREQESKFHVHNAVSIIGFSADISDEMTADMLAAGANCVLPKPPEPGELERLCREVLQRRKSNGIESRRNSG